MFQDVSTRVLTLRADHYSSLGIMRSLGRLGVRTFVVHSHRDAAPLKSRYCAGAFIWDLDTSHDSSNCLSGTTGRKIHQTPVYTGMTALGVCLPNSVVHAQVCRLGKETGYKGILD